MIFRKNSTKGFTLIELLVVISIIAILTSVVLASLNNARTKGRDAKRKTELRSFTTALELYKNANGVYPTGPGCGNDGDGCLFSDITGLSSHISTIPVDPLNDPANGYVYRYQVDANDRASAGILFRLESTSDPASQGFRVKVSEQSFSFGGALSNGNTLKNITASTIPW